MNSTTRSVKENAQIVALAEQVRVLTERLQVVEGELRALKTPKAVRGALQMPKQQSNVRITGVEVSPSEYFRTEQIKPFNTCPVPLAANGKLIDPNWRYDTDTDEYLHLAQGVDPAMEVMDIPAEKILERVTGGVVRTSSGMRAACVG